MRFWAVACSSCLDNRLCTVSLTVFWFKGVRLFFHFTAKRIVGELSKSFLLVEVGAPNDYRATFVGRFDGNVLGFIAWNGGWFKSADHSSGLRLEDLLSRLIMKLGLKTSCRHFWRKKYTVANWPSGEVHLDLRLLSFWKTSFSEELELLLPWKNALILELLCKPLSVFTECRKSIYEKRWFELWIKWWLTSKAIREDVRKASAIF